MTTHVTLGWHTYNVGVLLHYEYDLCWKLIVFVTTLIFVPWLRPPAKTYAVVRKVERRPPFSRLVHGEIHAPLAADPSGRTMVVLCR